jgi:uncharacterized protein (DUF433 family)
MNDSFTGISLDPGVLGGEAHISGTRIPVWLLVQARRLGVTDADLVRDYPTLSARDLANATDYARTHAEEIDQAITENEAG